LIVSSFPFRIFGILLIFVDVFLVVNDIILTEHQIHVSLACRISSLSIALFFVMDILLQIYVVGKQHYFSDVFNVFDSVIIGVTLAFDLLYMLFDFHSNVSRFTVLFRPLRLISLIRMFHLAYQKRQLEKLTRRLVSGNKRRYTKDGFDLDLTYITERIIAMSFPSSGKQSFYRNPIQEVARFLDLKHENHYQVYNLCSERSYDPKYFHNRIHRIMIDDHNVPTLKEMVVFSKEANAWMAQDDKNILVIHCKGGKGRTGTMVCACLLACGMFLTAESRYVRYFEKVKSDYKWDLPLRQNFIIKNFIIYSIHGNGTDLKIHIVMHRKTVFSSSSSNCRIFHDIESDRVIFIIINSPVLYDDVKVQFFSTDLPKYYDNCCFFFWFHTSFIKNNRLTLTRNQLDNPHKPKTWKIYRPDFAVEVYFDETTQN
uniref:Phosphatidylinositol 3,4,5-trisphosphate 3-phosphatase TPTE2-like n=1 Tax=Marmota marmota marmota TaxID=9994 RepID=A0A8C6A8Q3_MARMA